MYSNKKNKIKPFKRREKEEIKKEGWGKGGRKSVN